MKKCVFHSYWIPPKSKSEARVLTVLTLWFCGKWFIYSSLASYFKGKTYHLWLQIRQTHHKSFGGAEIMTFLAPPPMCKAACGKHWWCRTPAKHDRNKGENSLPSLAGDWHSVSCWTSDDETNLVMLWNNLDLLLTLSKPSNEERTKYKL